MDKHEHDDSFKPHVRQLNSKERARATGHLLQALEAAGSKPEHEIGEVDPDRVDMLLDLLLVRCTCTPTCNRTVAEQIGLDLHLSKDQAPATVASVGPAPTAASRAASGTGAAHGAAIGDLSTRPRTLPNSGSYLHNLGHLLAG